MQQFLKYFIVILFFTKCIHSKDYTNGYIEGESQYISSTTSGILKNIYVKRGDTVKTGQCLFALDETELNSAIEIAIKEIQKAEAILNKDEKEYKRAQKLVASNAMSQHEFEIIKYTYDASNAQLDLLKQNLIIAKKKLEDSKPKALKDSYVNDTFFITGEFVQSGQPVISLLNDDAIKIRFFISQKKISQITIGEYISILCDGCKQPINAQITYISKQAEYTPPMIYSIDSRKKMVFMVEAKPEKQENYSLKPGLPVDVFIKKVNK